MKKKHSNQEIFFLINNFKNLYDIPKQTLMY
jgi:hypothetical protein